MEIERLGSGMKYKRSRAEEKRNKEKKILENQKSETVKMDREKQIIKN